MNRETDSEESDTEECSEESKSSKNKKLKTVGSFKTNKEKPKKKFCDTKKGAISSTAKAGKTCEKGLRCSEKGCGARFSRRDSLEDHGRSKHGKAKLRCSEPGCEKEYFYKFTLIRHINTIHKKLKPYECKEDTCQRKFTEKRSVEDHCRSEHGAPKLNCKLCNQQFIFAWSMWKHTRKEHMS